MPIIPRLMANRWMEAPRAHCRLYPLYSKLLYSIAVISKKKYLFVAMMFKTAFDNERDDHFIESRKTSL